MKLDEIHRIIEEGGVGQYLLILDDGSTIKARLFIDDKDNVCRFRKGSRTRGYPVTWNVVSDPFPDYSRIVSLVKAPEKPRRNVPSFSAFQSNLRKLDRILSASGLWPSIRNDARTLIDLGKAKQKELYDIMEKIEDRENTDAQKREELLWKFSDFSCEYRLYMDYFSFSSLMYPNRIRTVRYPKSSQEECKDEIRKMIADARSGLKKHSKGSDPFRDYFRWFEAYDYTVHVTRDVEGVCRGWYSEEFHGREDGYYYLLLDETYAFINAKTLYPVSKSHEYLYTESGFLSHSR